MDNKKSVTFCEMHKPSGCEECPNRCVCKKEENTAKTNWDLRAKRLELSLEAISLTADPDHEKKLAAIDAEIARISGILKGNDRMKCYCKTCGKEFEGSSDFAGFFTEPPQGPVGSYCKECTQAEMDRVAKLEADELDWQAEKEVNDCIL